MGSLSAPLHAQRFAHIDQMFFTKSYAGANPLPQVLTVTSTSSAFGFNASATTSSGGDWLAVSQTGDCCITPAPVSVIVSANAALAVGSYSGRVAFTGGGTSFIVNVTLVVAPLGGAVFDNTPGQLSFSMKPGGQPLSQVMQIRNAGTGALTWRLLGSTFNGANFLSASVDTATAPTLITLKVLPENLPNGGATEGVYTGQLLFLAAGSTVTVPVSVSVGDAEFGAMNPLTFAATSAGDPGLTFAATSLGDPGVSLAKRSPGDDLAPKSVTITSTGADFGFVLSSATANGGNWLSVSPAGDCCVTPQVLSIKVNPAVTLAPGSYTGQILVTTAKRAMAIPVTLTVAAPGARSTTLVAGTNLWQENTANVLCGGFVNQDTGYGANTLAPDGTNTAILVFEANPSSGPVPHFEYFFPSLAGVGQQTISFHFKASSNSWAYITSQVNGVTERVWFNLVGAGAVGTDTFLGIGGIPAITLANGWYRCSITFTVPVGQSAIFNGFGLANADQQFSYVATIGNGVFEWGQQFESGPLTAYQANVGPCLIMSNNEDQSTVGAGSTIGFTIGVGNVAAPGTGAAIAAVLNAPLPGGTGINWSIGPAAYAGPGTCAITGAVGSQTLTCNYGTLPGIGGGVPLVLVHVTSSTSASSCGSYTVSASASATNARTATSISNPTNVLCVNNGSALRFVPVTPCRIVDTRNPAGPFSGPALAGSVTRNFDIPVGPCAGIPANASAYSLNITVVPLGPLGFLAVWPAGQPQPVVSTLNSGDGRIKANAAIVPAGASGAISVFATNPSHVIVDINGYFIPAVGVQNLAFYPVTPCRVADTRVGTGTFGGPSMAANVARNFPVPASSCGIPTTANAYALNMTVVPSGVLGFLATWPAGSPQPGVSTLNAPTGAVTANAAIVPVGVNGGIAVLATTTSDLIIDINGYFAPPGAAGSLDFFAATPCRIVDTRNPAGPFGGPVMGAGESRSFVVPSSACGIPVTAKAYSLNATVVPPAALGFLRLWGSGAMPSVSTLNAGDGTVVANAALVPAGPGGAISAFTSDPSHVILDINGYFQ
jgi:hypothetical protein